MSHSHADSHELGHTVPFKTHFLILGILLVLTFVTVWVAQIDFGVFNIVVAMGIASVKAGLVGLFFMHLKYENPLIWLYVAFPIMLLAVLIGGLFVDNPFREVPGKPSYRVEQAASPADGHKSEVATEAAH